MADARLAWLPATELAAMIRKRTVSPVEVVDAAARYQAGAAERPWAQQRPVLE